MGTAVLQAKKRERYQLAFEFFQVIKYVLFVKLIMEPCWYDPARPSECDDVIRRAHVSRSRGLPHREGTDGCI